MMANRIWSRLALWLLFSLSAAWVQADALLDEVSKKLAANVNLHADFVQTRQMTVLKKPLQLGGRMAFSRADGVLWQISKPYPLGYVMTARGVSELLPSGSRRERAARGIPGIGSVEGLFRGLLAADKAVLQQHFVVVAQGTSASWTLQLTPKPGPLQKGISAAELSGGAQLEKVLLKEASGDSTLIRFSRIDPQSPLSADEKRLLGAS